MRLGVYKRIGNAIRREASLSQITTALGTLIDKWAMISDGPSDNAKEDELSKSLREMEEELESDG